MFSNSGVDMLQNLFCNPKVAQPFTNIKTYLLGKLFWRENCLHPPSAAAHSSHQSTAQTFSQLGACHPSQSPPPWLSGKCSAQCSLRVNGLTRKNPKGVKSSDFQDVLKLRWLLDNGCISRDCRVPFYYATNNIDMMDRVHI